MKILARFGAVFALCKYAASFSPTPSIKLVNHAASKSYQPLFMFFADTAESIPSDVRISQMDGSEQSIDQAAEFLVDSFWLRSPQQLIVLPIEGSSEGAEIPESVRTSLVAIQADDLMKKYGERLGRRKLDAFILTASERVKTDGQLLNADEVLGLVTVEVRLLDLHSKDILGADISEKILTEAVASLGPKQRREYKNRPVTDIATELLPPELSAVCSLSNLCVAPSARRKGVAVKLCLEAERIAKDELGFDNMFLRVEADNTAAKKLYEDKLGYDDKFVAESATALRVDSASGSFVEIDSPIVIMTKQI